MYPFNFVTCEGIELLELARQQDMGFIAMKPFAGGRIKDIAVAIKYLLRFPDVLVLPGLGNIDQAKQTLSVLKNPQMMPEEEQAMQNIREEMDRRFCRHCDYCLPCPQGIPVSMVLDYEPLSLSFPEESFYTGHMGEMMVLAEKCDDCGECEKKCPYNITVRAMITEYVQMFHDGRKKYLAKKS
jgi:predicted aldo/keto reductase-like oxidoreductase